MLDEISALRFIRDNFSDSSDDVFIGPGDDCAVIEFGENRFMLITTDSLVENYHFKKSLISPTVLGLRAVSVSVSDIAAMGGTPKYYLSSLGFKNEDTKDFFSEIFNGFKNASLEYDIDLIGGNITQCDTTFIDITVLGDVEKDSIVKRAGASEGDIIYVTGTPGDSGLGLRMLMDGIESEESSYLINRHIYPAPRVQVGKRLGKSQAASAMIDISDGLLIDLERISVEQGLGADIYAEKIPLSEEYITGFERLDLPKYELALTAGEDYELLFTSSPEKKDEIRNISEQTGVRITEIGTISSSKKIDIYDPNGFTMNFKKRGFFHFSP